MIVQVETSSTFSVESERFERLQQRLDHLNLEGQISDIRIVPLSTPGSTCDMYRGTLTTTRRRLPRTIPIAIKKLRFYLYEGGMVDDVCISVRTSSQRSIDLC